MRTRLSRTKWKCEETRADGFLNTNTIWGFGSIRASASGAVVW